VAVRQEEPLRGRTILVTGGTRGTGLAGALEWHRLGADIVLGARSMARYEEVCGTFPGGRVSPFVADLTDPTSIPAAIDRLMAPGVRVTDVVHCAAAGLEPQLRPLMRAVIALRRVAPGPDLDLAIGDHRGRLAALATTATKDAWSVNFESPREVTRLLAPSLTAGARVIAYSSVWSVGFPSGQCPGFYSAVAESKLALEAWLAEQATGAWRGGRIRPTVLVGHVIRDTTSGQFIDRHLTGLMTPPDQRAFRAAYISMAEMTAAASAILMESGTIDGLSRRYVVGGRGVSDSIDPEVQATAGRVPL
jgi:NAD(P)-dependent dehydrogenase (short-subunit alcohol dehydrogenase family)